MVPRANHQKVVILLVGFFEPAVGHDRTKEVFLVPPAGHVQVRNGWLMQGVCYSMALPEIVVTAVANKIVPSRNFPMEIFFVGVRKCAYLQIPLKHVEAVEGEAE